MTAEFSEYDDFVANDILQQFHELRPLYWFEADCLTEDLATFFPKQGQSAIAAKAVAICQGCAVREECFMYAFNEGIEHGIWGGSKRDERKIWFENSVDPDDAYSEMIERERSEKAVLE